MADQPLFSLAVWKLWLGHKKICFPYVDPHPGNSECHFLDGSLHLRSPNGAVNCRFFPSFAPKQLQRQDMAPVVIHVNLDRMGHFMETDEFYRNLSLHLGRRFWHFWEEMWDLWHIMILLVAVSVSVSGTALEDCTTMTRDQSILELMFCVQVVDPVFCQNVFAFPAEDQVLVDEWFCPLFPWHYQLPASNKKPGRKADASTVLKWSNWWHSDWILFLDCYTEILEKYHTSTSGNQFETKTSNGALDPVA